MLRTPLFFMLFTLAACPYIPEAKYNDNVRDADGDGVLGDRFGGDDCRDDDPDIKYCDADGDGFLTVAAGGDDCDDDNPNVHPDAPERCNDIDDDCDNLIDDDDDIVDSAPLWYADDDQDGYGDVEESFQSCVAPPNTVDDNRDCDDGDAEIKPGATEFCDDADRNCDGDSTSGAVDPTDWYDDQDGDGYGAGPVLTTACAGPAGSVEDNTDCDDSADSAFPGAEEIWYDDIDQDCLGGSDHDQDGDGYNAMPGGPDCDDTSIEISPDAEEICDGNIDNDCNGVGDNDDPGVNTDNQWTYYLDSDGDSFGDDATASLYCPNSQPANWVLVGSDCDDTISSVSPVGVEVCDTLDNDCDGQPDNGAIGQVEYYLDNDGDGYGDSPILACELQPGYATVDGDCNDADAQTYPGAPELCGDAFRQDCSLLSIFDCDSDGFVDELEGGDDCDDTQATVYPGANEVCDGFDNDCNGLTDSDDPDVDLSTVEDFYLDSDEDGFGGVILVAQQACAPIPGASANDDDCDDSDPLTYPGALEICDGRDNSCEGDIDEGPIADPVQYYLDADEDGFGNSGIVSALGCDPPVDSNTWVTDDSDCHDGEPLVNPLAEEICDSLDNDCDTLIDQDDPTATLPLWYRDDDSDGYGQTFDTLAQCNQPAGYSPTPGDCNDFEPTANPGAEEICDGGIDNDCDTLGDDADPDLITNNSWYPDADSDGFGEDVAPTIQCSQPAGFTNNNLDCDDTNPTISPAALEVCDGDIDNDCDGNADDADDDTTNQPSWFEDADTDGWGSTSSTTQACTIPEGFLPQAGDCDDTRGDINPSAAEICDGEDNDCDSLIDDADDDTVLTTWHNDADGDGFGSPTDFLFQCADPGLPYTLDTQDCDDTDIAINPAGLEICDFKDNDCDGLTDDADPSVDDPLPWYPDEDGDGFGDENGVAVEACLAPQSTSSNNLDCLDTDAQVNPSTPIEFCNGVDDDCDGLLDDLDQVVDGGTYFADTDGDGYGDDGASQEACVQPAGTSQNGADCNDNNSAVHPGATEVCNGVDDDCDDLVDDDDNDIGGAPPWYLDNDGDSFGDANRTDYRCLPLPGYVLDDTDCDDGDSAVHPDAAEICNGIDDNCDSQIDDDDPILSNAPSWFLDGDGDGFGLQGTNIEACAHPGGYADNDLDCNDGSDQINPSGLEICDGLDNDCDSLIDDDDGVAGTTTWYADGDSDTYGDPSVTQQACEMPLDFVANSKDCNDNEPLVNPDADEICDGSDNDCNGWTDDSDPGLIADIWYFDADGDGYGREEMHTTACSAPNNWVSGPDFDCDDLNPTVYPLLAPEICDGLDNDCNALTDDDDGNVIDQTTWYRDVDGDGYSDDTVAAVSCVQPPDAYAESLDCDDTDASIHPLAVEICDLLDNNCDNRIDDDDPTVVGNIFFTDFDGDGFGDPLSPVVACSAPGAVTNSEDCDDQDPSLYPGQTLTVGPVGGYATINEAISASCDYGIIQIYPGNWSEALDLGGRPLTIEGIDPNNPPVLNPNAAPVVNIPATSGLGTRLSNLIISSRTAGSAVTVSNADVTFEGVQFAENNAPVFGGGLHISNGANVVVEQCDFSENIAISGAGIYATNSDVVVIDSTFYANDASSSGGAITSVGSASMLTVLGGSFTYNVAGDFAAAIETNNSGESYIFGPEFSYNGGPSVLSINASSTLDSVTVRDSAVSTAINSSTLGTPMTLDILNSQIYGNDKGLYASAGPLTVTLKNTGVWGNQVGLELQNDDSVVENVTLVRNNTGILIDEAGTIVNTILYDNATNLDATGNFAGPVTYNLFTTPGEANTWGGTNISDDPKFVTYQANLPNALWDLHIKSISLARFNGDPAVLNADGTPSDIGMHGGPGGEADWYQDEDSDSVPDGWERTFFDNIDLYNGSDDPDGDALVNSDEFGFGTNPTVTDTDGDGLDDGSDAIPLDPNN
jgi:large repetitive protein